MADYHKLREALERATEGEWRVGVFHWGDRDVYAMGGDGSHCINGESVTIVVPVCKIEPHDAAFIALALNELPALLADYDRMLEALTEVEKGVLIPITRVDGESVDATVAKRPNWVDVYHNCVHKPDRDQDLIPVTRETLRLALSAIQRSQEQDAYHHYAAAAGEISAALQEKDQPK